jgi:hypothetical protein
MGNTRFLTELTNFVNVVNVAAQNWMAEYQAVGSATRYEWTPSPPPVNMGGV